MRFQLDRQSSTYVVAIAILIVSIGLIESLDRSQKSFLRDSRLDRAREELSIIRSEIEAAIVSDIYVANAIPALVASNPDFDFFGWDLIASSIMRKGSHVIVIALAPNDVIEYIYPREGNEQALKLDYRTVPKQWRSVKKAQQLQEIFVSGPVNLVQGGRGLIARVPIFSDPPYNAEYWGVCSLVISLESLFDEVGTQAFEFKYDLAIQGTDSMGEHGEIFYGTQSTFDNAFAKESVYFPYGNWVIAASTRSDLLKNEKWYRAHAVRMIGYPMVALLLIAFFVIYRLYVVANKRSLEDELTRLPNRRYFLYTLKSQFENAKNNGDKASFALLNIDLDHFKVVNDTYGHAAGDKVLIAVAERLKGALRSSDVIARIGGDEYLALLPRVVSEEDVEAIQQQLLRVIGDTPVIYEGNLINLHASIGCVMYRPEFQDADEMMIQADRMMYVMKRNS